MTRERKILWGVGLALGVVVLALFFTPRIRRSLGPVPQSARVGIEIEGEGITTVGGVHQIAAGTPFSLHAVLLATTRSGRPVYYSDVDRLRIDGAEVPAGSIRRWGAETPVKILWFSVEPAKPFLEATSPSDLAALRYEAVFRPDWPQAWSIPGSVTPSSRNLEAGALARPALPFGVQRYQAKIELYGSGSQLVPQQRFASGGPDELLAHPESFPTVVATLPAPLDQPTGVFGLPQVRPAASPSRELLDRLAQLSVHRLAFSRAGLLGGIVERWGLAWSDLRWRQVALDGSLSWGGTGAAAGDLVRAGNRVVVLDEDQGLAGRLDRDDLCFDFDKAPAVRALGEVFTGGGVVEWVGRRTR